MPCLFPTGRFKRINPKEFDSNKYNSNCVFEADFKYFKELL